MNKEEKEAIEYIKAFQKDLYGASEKNLMAIYIDRVWNYIDKLQKENEELKELTKEQMLFTFKNNTLDSIELVKNDFISKDKIRNKIKELEEESNYAEGIDYECNLAMQDILKELLEEN